MLPDFEERFFEPEPLARAQTVPSSWYTHPGFLAIDNRHIFSKTWQYVGHLSQVENAGEFLTTTVAENPVIVVRDKQGVLRAFFNVCRHRGGPIETSERGSCKILQCKYHGWTYQLDGSLRGVPQWNYVELFDKKDYGLIPVEVTTWGGLIFVSLDKNAVPLNDIFDGLGERVRKAGHSDRPDETLFSKKQFFRRVVYPVKANWKVYADNYLEGYHLPFVHPELCTMLDYRQYVTETYRYYSLQYSPFLSETNVYGSNSGEALYYFVWPNFMLNIMPGRLQVNRIVPDGFDRCHVIFDYYYDDLSEDSVKKVAENDLEYSDRIQKEDCEICEYVQKGLASAAYDRGRFSVECENAVHHFQDLLKTTYREAYRSGRDS